MRAFPSIVCLALALASAAPAAASAPTVGQKPRPHRALAQPGPAARAGCLDRFRLSAEHTAYIPSADIMPPRCGRLLSIDTLISAAHHWDQT